MVSPVPDNQPLLYFVTWNDVSYTVAFLKHVYEGASPLDSDAEWSVIIRKMPYYFLTRFQ